ncbi:MAG: aldo/keto reductase [Thermoplasmataceae archaeon]
MGEHLKQFGRAEAKVSEIGVGTFYDAAWILRSRFAAPSKSEKARRIEAIKAALDSGINLIDTAEIYGSETLVGEAIKGYDREGLFIATKVFPTNFSPSRLERSCERSLRKLGVKYIDLYQLHFPLWQNRISDALHTMERLVDQGKIRYIGISNFSLKQTKMACEALRKHPLISTQMNFSLMHRDIEMDILPYCVENNIEVLAYYPLGHGKLLNQGLWSSEQIQNISKKYGGKTLSQIVLNWFVSKYNNVFPIPRASNPDHVRENAGAMGWRMEKEDIQILESLAIKLAS